MTETETKRNHECSYNKYYNMPSREKILGSEKYITQLMMVIRMKK